MPKLADNEIKKRLKTFHDIGLKGDPKKILSLITEGNMPPALEKSLEVGNIILDPMPNLKISLGSSTIDLGLGNQIEVPDIPFEVVQINNETVIRPFVVDFRQRHNNRQKLEDYTEVEKIDQSWKRFFLRNDVVFELPVRMQVNIFTRQIICIPPDLEGNLDGRSCFARKGITTHITSSRFDAGFCGFLTLEVLNGGSCNFNLQPDLQAASIGFTKLSSPANVPYYKKKDASFSGQS